MGQTRAGIRSDNFCIFRPNLLRGRKLKIVAGKISYIDNVRAFRDDRKFLIIDVEAIDEGFEVVGPLLGFSKFDDIIFHQSG